jgi:hypothetical protein
MEAESRGSALVMLRSAEADPHVTKRASSRPASRTPPPPVPRVAPPPEGVGLSCGGTSLQSGRGHAEPRRPKPGGSTSPPHPSMWHLRRHPLPGFAVNAALVEQLTSGLYSADESVETHRRFQRCVTRVSHGLGSPSRSCCFRLRPMLRRAGARCSSESRIGAGKPALLRPRRSHHGESRWFVPRYPSASSPRRRVLPPKR